MNIRVSPGGRPDPESPSSHLPVPPRPVPLHPSLHPPCSLLWSLGATGFFFFWVWLLPCHSLGSGFLISSTSLFSTSVLIRVLATLTTNGNFMGIMICGPEWCDINNWLCICLLSVSHSFPISSHQIVGSMRAETKCVWTLLGWPGLDYSWSTAGRQ